MRDPALIRSILEEIERIWLQHPDWRLGQLVSNLVGWAEESVWDVEDDALLNEIQRHLEQAEEVAQVNKSVIDEGTV